MDREVGRIGADLAALAGAALGAADFVGLADLAPWVTPLSLGLLGFLVYDVSPHLLGAIDHGRPGTQSAFHTPLRRLGLLALTAGWFLVWLPHVPSFGRVPMFGTGWLGEDGRLGVAILVFLSLLLASAAVVGAWLLHRDPRLEGILSGTLYNGYRALGPERAREEIEQIRQAARADRRSFRERLEVGLGAFAGGTIVVLPVCLVGLVAAGLWTAPGFVYLGAAVAAGAHVWSRWRGGGPVDAGTVAEGTEAHQRALFGWRPVEWTMEQAVEVLAISAGTVGSALGFISLVVAVGPRYVDLLSTSLSSALAFALEGRPDAAANLLDLLLAPGLVLAIPLAVGIFSLFTWSRLALRLGPRSDSSRAPDSRHALPRGTDALFPALQLVLAATLAVPVAGWRPSAWSPGTGWPRLVLSLVGLAAALAAAGIPIGLVASRVLRDPAAPRLDGDRVRIGVFLLASLVPVAVVQGSLEMGLVVFTAGAVYALPELSRAAPRAFSSRPARALARSTVLAAMLTAVSVSLHVALDVTPWVYALPVVGGLAMVSADLLEHGLP